MRLLLLLLLINTTALGQSTNNNTANKIASKESIPDFKTAGEQEEYNVKQMFRKEYKKQYYKRFSGIVKATNNAIFQFDTLIMLVNYTSNELRLIFGQGILYPFLFGSEDSLRITDLQELKYVDNKPTYKRFSLWLFRKWLVNPQVYYIELTNENAVKTTDLKDFIKGAHLTYFRPGRIII